MLKQLKYGRSRALFSLIYLCVGSTSFASQDVSDEEAGYRIAALYDQANSNWVDSYSMLTMKLIKGGKEVSTRRMEVRAIERDDDGDMSIMRFHEPRDVRDTAFLTHNNLGAFDDQWLYLPSLRRIKRINSANRSGPFMGSQFSFEDMSGFQLEEYSYRLLEEVDMLGAKHYVLELNPADKNSGYERIVYFIDKDRLTLTAAEYTSKKTGNVSKRLENSEFERFDEKHWRPRVAIMRDMVRDRATHLLWDVHRFDNGFGEEMFTQGALRVWRD